MNNRKFLEEVVILLERNGIKAWIFGGWAEELRAVIEPRVHKDIDLLYLAENFSQVDHFLISNRKVKEIEAKHFSHKRAFIYKGIMIEMILLQKDVDKLFTKFWDSKMFIWPSDTLDYDQQNKYSLASKSALADYRKKHATIHNKYVQEY